MFSSHQQFGTPQQQTPQQPVQQPQPQPPVQQQQQAPFAQPSFNPYGSVYPPPFAGPQFGGGNNGLNTSGGAPAYGNPQFGYAPPQQPQFGGGGPIPQAQGGSQQGASGGNFGEKAGKRYLPGYLSSGTHAQAEPTPPQSDESNSRAWDSPAHRNSISGSPVSRFSQSLFGSQRDSGTPSRSPKSSQFRESRGNFYRNAEMDDDAPPVDSLGELDADDSSMSFSSPTPVRISSPERRPTLSSTHSSSSISTSTPSGPSASSSSSISTAVKSVYVYGFPASALSLVVDHFAQFGEVINSVPSPEGGNWVTITYSQPWDALRAARRNGDVLGGVLMVGVKSLDEEGLKKALEGESVDETIAAPVAAPVGTTGRFGTLPTQASGLGKPVTVVGPGGAFRPPAPSPPKRGIFGGAPVLGPGGKVDPHASLFTEKNRQAMLKQQEGQKGVLGKVSDLVFGW